MKVDSILDVRRCRRVFYSSDLLFWILGWASLAVGIWLYMDRNTYAGLVPTSYSAMSTAGLCISMGGMVLIIAFVGLCGAWIESKCLLISYFCFVSLLFVVQCITGVLGYFYKDAVRERVKHGLYATINRTASSAVLSMNGQHGVENNLKLTWNQMQSKLKCCGVANYTDWYFSPQWPNHRFVPDSCCNASHFVEEIGAMTNCGKSVANEPLFYKEGCYEPFTDWLLQHLLIVGILALLFAMVEVLALLTSLRLICHMHSKRKFAEPSFRYSREGGGTIHTEGQSSLLETIDNT